MSRIKIIGFMAVVMLILLMTTGFFSIPIGVSACSAIGIMYGYKYKDRIFVRWSTVTLVAENGAYPPTQNGLIHPQLLLKWP